MNHLLASSNYLLIFMGDKSLGRGGGFERSRISIIMVCARAAPKEGVLLALSRQAFTRFLLADL